MTLPSRHPRPLYSAQASGGQEAAHTQTQLQAGAPTDRQRHDVEDQVLAALEEAARASQPAPGYRTLAARLGRTDRPIRSALAKLESQGRIRRISTRTGNRYEIPALGLTTAPHRTAAPLPPKPAPPVAWNHKRDNRLTEPQRQVLSAARLEIAETGDATPAKIARRLGISESAAYHRLRRIALHGHLAQRADRCYVLAAPTAASAPDGARIEIRNGVRVTICPPRYADGALLYRPTLGVGSGRRR